MISAKAMTMVAMLALAGGAVAQEQADEQRIGELIEQLKGDIADDWAEQFVAVCRLSRRDSRFAIDRLARVVRETPTTNLPTLVRVAVDLSPFYGEGVSDKIVGDIIDPIGFRSHNPRTQASVLSEILRLGGLLSHRIYPPRTGRPSNTAGPWSNWPSLQRARISEPARRDGVG